MSLGVNSKSIHCHQTEKYSGTVCVDLVFDSKYVQFREICSLQCSTIINTFCGVDPHSELLKKIPVKPKNTEVLLRVNSLSASREKGNSCQYNYNEASIESVLLTLANAYKTTKRSQGLYALYRRLH